MFDASYYSSLDPIPLQDEKYNKLYKFYEYLAGGRFTTTNCKSCEEIFWPPRTICPKCRKSKSLEWVDIPKKGKIVQYAIQINGVPPGYANPLVLGIIDFSNGVRIVSSIDPGSESIREGGSVELVVRKCDDGRVMPNFRVVK